MNRIDINPTVEYQGYAIGPGRVLPFGATLVSGGINFSVYSRNAKSCTLVLFDKGEKQPMVEIPYPEDFRLGDVYSMVVFGLAFENIEYGYRFDGEYDFKRGHLYNKENILLDPYTKAVGGRSVWGTEPDWGDIMPHRSKIIADDFDWQGDKPLEIPMEDLVIYECNVRGFTKHESSKVKYPGTFAGFRDKIPYLKELGVNCVELMPIYEFDEFENSKPSPITGERMLNYWGYSSIAFFAPKAGLAAGGKNDMQVDELKNLIKHLHKNGIEVILDVVFNHTAEGNENGPSISFRGIDNKIYYMLTEEGYYYNFSGCGNTVNCNHPIVRNMILDCLRYWASEYHIDGFRFDLAAIMGRNQDGSPMHNPPLLEILAYDPVLSRCKLIAEAWDAGGLYQVGNFPSWGHFSEWNGKYRNAIRKLLKGDENTLHEAVTRILGSSDLYSHQGMGTNSSINFINCHDGFTLMDLVSYNDKHNEANGEDNRDGSDDNCSWNCGWEGESSDPAVNQLRKMQVKNALTVLMLSRGVPMFLAGDEFGNTQFGNNNAYCQDNEISWLDWKLTEQNKEILDFAKGIIAFRNAHPVLRGNRHVAATDYQGFGKPDVSIHGVKPWEPDYGGRAIALMYSGDYAKDDVAKNEDIYFAINSHWDTLYFEPPGFDDGKAWHLAVNTSMPPGQDVYAKGDEPLIDAQNNIVVGGRSMIVLIRR
ncbi:MULTISPECIES: glycogen debranching protein GlgX [unclassified Fusibacter]|uniref:glycogen debranching protein GlgX n=1 Tax=unclassified Fusibacter TaxID=2624464 RepID=UPI001012D7B1|nr:MULTISPECIES: glycogen debranching protein GlgX [unclassified Fusibacter]MCK8058467.1 glycogen debranching protein GlgX [Fusibacter sp. A2]NPE22765.1 glycogen debranching protein GlgX [Fusibacter sp. A1]RXV60323.1 glycogen debranching enzyme GlgX [Fusibacter sp. A1]